jgi:hypothetical protein
MNDQTRRAVAYIAGRIVSGSAAASLYDHATGRSYAFRGEFAATEITLRDLDSGSAFKGAGGSGMFTITQSGNGRPVSLRFNGSAFEGFDYETAKRYRGAVSGKSVAVQDEQHAREFQYSI